MYTLYTCTYIFFWWFSGKNVATCIYNRMHSMYTWANASASHRYVCVCTRVNEWDSHFVRCLLFFSFGLCSVILNALTTTCRPTDRNVIPFRFLFTTNTCTITYGSNECMLHTHTRTIFYQNHIDSVLLCALHCILYTHALNTRCTAEVVNNNICTFSFIEKYKTHECNALRVATTIKTQRIFRFECILCWCLIDFVSMWLAGFVYNVYFAAFFLSITHTYA